MIEGIVDKINKITSDLAESDAVVLENFKRSIQVDSFSCGAQCAFMILQYYGKARSIKNVMRELRTSPDNGTSEENLRKLFTKRGLVARRINKPSIKKIKEKIDQGYPVLVAVDDSEHWAVVYGYGKDSIYVADPSIFRALFCRHSIDKFMERWDTWALAVES